MEEECEGEEEECYNLAHRKTSERKATPLGRESLRRTADTSGPLLILETGSFADSWSYPIHISINIDLRYLARQMVLSPQFHNDEYSLETAGFGIKSPQ